MKARFLCCLALFGGDLPAKDPAEPWPGVEFAHVAAYCYDYTRDERGFSIVFKDRTLHKGIIQATTVRLSPPQIETLRTLVATESDEDGEVECYDPHHAFVFYDRDWKPVAWIDICFSCDDWSAVPGEGVAEIIDLQKLKGFCREIGLPVFEDENAYGRLFLQERPAAEAGKAAVKLHGRPDDGTSDPFGGHGVSSREGEERGKDEKATGGE